MSEFFTMHLAYVILKISMTTGGKARLVGLSIGYILLWYLIIPTVIVSLTSIKLFRILRLPSFKLFRTYEL